MASVTFWNRTGKSTNVLSMARHMIMEKRIKALKARREIYSTYNPKQAKKKKKETRKIRWRWTAIYWALVLVALVVGYLLLVMLFNFIGYLWGDRTITDLDWQTRIPVGIAFLVFISLITAVIMGSLTDGKDAALPKMSRFNLLIGFVIFLLVSAVFWLFLWPSAVS